MDELINTLNIISDNLQEAEVQFEFDLPQIVVVGDQSAGKTSVLENFLGRDFLPRGTGIVTRRPLILQLIQSNVPAEYGEFLHLKSKKFYDFDQIKKEIVSETNRLLGNEANISDVPINLKIYSKSVINLTVVDLPGLTKVAVGMQDNDMPQQIENLVLSYISNPNSVILVVVPAIVDIANSHALKLAKQVDQNYFRTIGVLTKIDLMDQGTDCRGILENKMFPLYKGWIGIVNRGQKDINQKKDINTAIEDEEKYFLNNENYKHLIKNCGTKNLQKILHNELKNSIAKNLPQLSQKLNELLMQHEKILKVHLIKRRISDTSLDESQIALSLVQDYVKKLQNNLGISANITSFEELSIGAQIQIILNHVFNYKIAKCRSKSEDIRKMICTAINNADGMLGSIELPDVVIRSVIRSLINIIEPAVLDMVARIKKELDKCITESLDKTSVYSFLNNKLEEMCKNYVAKSEERLLNYMKFFIECERGHINFKHPDFTSSRKSIDYNRNFDKFKSRVEIINNDNLGRATFMVLEGDTLFLYRKPTDKEIYTSINVRDCKLKGKKNAPRLLILYHPSKNLLMGVKKLEMLLASKNLVNSWKAVYLSRGVVHDKLDPAKVGFNTESLSPDMIAKVEKVKILVEKYLNIVTKKLQDLSIKTCIHLMINKFDEYTKNELFYKLSNAYSTEELLEVDVSMQEWVNKVQKTYETLKDCILLVDRHLPNPGSKPYRQLYDPTQSNLLNLPNLKKDAFSDEITFSPISDESELDDEPAHLEHRKTLSSSGTKSLERKPNKNKFFSCTAIFGKKASC